MLASWAAGGREGSGEGLDVEWSRAYLFAPVMRTKCCSVAGAESQGAGAMAKYCLEEWLCEADV